MFSSILCTTLYAPPRNIRITHSTPKQQQASFESASSPGSSRVLREEYTHTYTYTPV